MAVARFANIRRLVIPSVAGSTFMFTFFLAFRAPSREGPVIRFRSLMALHIYVFSSIFCFGLPIVTPHL